MIEEGEETTPALSHDGRKFTTKCGTSFARAMHTQAVPDTSKCLGKRHIPSLPRQAEIDSVKLRNVLESVARQEI